MTLAFLLRLRRRFRARALGPIPPAFFATIRSP
jgi:hypothetical protein